MPPRRAFCGTWAARGEPEVARVHHVAPTTTQWLQERHWDRVRRAWRGPGRRAENQRSPVCIMTQLEPHWLRPGLRVSGFGFRDSGFGLRVCTPVSDGGSVTWAARGEPEVPRVHHDAAHQLQRRACGLGKRQSLTPTSIKNDSLLKLILLETSHF